MFVELTKEEVKEIMLALRESHWDIDPSLLKKLKAEVEPVKSVSVVSWENNKGVRKYHMIRHNERLGMEFPGGKIEEGETVEEAGKREFEEEYGRIENKEFSSRKLFEIVHDWNEVTYHCTVVSFGNIGRVIQTACPGKTTPTLMHVSEINASKKTFKDIVNLALAMVEAEWHVNFNV